MTLTQFISNMSTLLTKITDRLLAVPNSTTAVVSATNTTGMQFMSGMPMSMYNIATSNAEVTALQTGTVDFLDVRTSTYWTKTSGSWVSSAYTGNKAFLRINSLVMGRNNGKVYYFADSFICYLVNTTTPST
jgi:hypothetical protein